MKKYVELEDVIQRLDNAIYATDQGQIGSYREAMKRLRVAYSETMSPIEINEGWWINEKDVLRIPYCSNCQEEVQLDEDYYEPIFTNWCPHCGTRMLGIRHTVKGKTIKEER